MNKKHKITIILLLVSILAVFLAIKIKPSPEQAFNTFLTSTNRAEDQLMDPLILAGKDVVPLVIQHVKKKNSKRRLYAISFLGNTGLRSSLPVLKAIYNDQYEGIFRAYAMAAIAQIDLQHAKELAHSYLINNETNDSIIEMYAKDIIAEDKGILERRSYWDALTWKHY